MFEVHVDLIDSDFADRVFEITQNGDQLHVRAHVDLAANEIRAACSQLGELEEPVFHAWAQRVGLEW